MTIVAPNGCPVAFQASAAVTVDVTVAVAHNLIDAQIARLLEVGVPPLNLIEMLVHQTGNLLSRFEPSAKRSELIDATATSLKRDAQEKARRRGIAAAMSPR